MKTEMDIEVDRPKIKMKNIRVVTNRYMRIHFKKVLRKLTDINLR